MASTGLHESARELSQSTIDRHRAITSLMEELEAVDWYEQRVDATADEELGAILAHNRDEERELTAAFSGGALVLMAAGALLSLLWFRRLV